MTQYKYLMEPLFICYETNTISIKNVEGIAYPLLINPDFMSEGKK
jgi:hypothetical protein